MRAVDVLPASSDAALMEIALPLEKTSRYENLENISMDQLCL